MIRPFTLVCALLAAGSGLYLYQTKHQAQLLDRQIRQVREATDVTLAHAGLLRAEYALLNDPERLGELAGAYLPDLRPTQPRQWTSMAELDRRLPSVGAPTADPSPLEPDVAPMVVPAAPSPPIPAVAARPVPVARMAVARAAVARTAPRAIVLAARQPQAAIFASLPTAPIAPVARIVPVAQVQVAHSNAAPPIALRVSPPAPAEVYQSPPATTAEAVNRIAHGGAFDPSVPVVASALGMARAMMTVSPVSSANAATFYPAVATR